MREWPCETDEKICKLGNVRQEAAETTEGMGTWKTSQKEPFLVWIGL